MSSPDSPKTDDIEVTPEMIDAGVAAVVDVIGAEPLMRGEADRIAEGVYRAMQPLAKSR